jgi:WhiB family redox-sensing transcriptional regulator
MTMMREHARTPSWEGAACAGEDPELWFPSEAATAASTAATAKEICSGCPIVEECAEYAIPIAELVGVWGNLTAAQRRQKRFERSAPARGDAVCLCGCDQLDHRRKFRGGRHKHGACRSCDCDEYTGVDGG